MDVASGPRARVGAMGVGRPSALDDMYVEALSWDFYRMLSGAPIYTVAKVPRPRPSPRTPRAPARARQRLPPAR